MLLHAPTSKNILESIFSINSQTKSDFLILCGEEVNLNIPDLIALLNENDIRFCGGFFPQVIHGNKSYKDKLLLLPVQFDSEPIIIEGLDSGNIDMTDLKLPDSSGSLFILVDGLSNYVSKFTYCLYKEIGPDYQVFGSGTGFENFNRVPCLFSNQGFFKDAAVIVLISNPITQSIRHGWKPIAGPYIATKTTANVIEQINWEPAYDVYKEIMEEAEGIALTEENYFDNAQYYPFGIHRAGEEKLIRDLAAVIENNAIRFGAEIPSNSVLYLMKSNTESMLSAGIEVCKDAISKSIRPKFLFFANCISRTWLLKDKFQKEIDNISAEAENIPVYGVLSLGEISSSNGALLDYHAKTIVISILENYGE